MRIDGSGVRSSIVPRVDDGHYYHPTPPRPGAYALDPVGHFPVVEHDGSIETFVVGEFPRIEPTHARTVELCF